jgi:hypothetical protein
VEASTRRFRVYSLFSSVGNDWMDILKSSGALRWKVEIAG